MHVHTLSVSINFLLASWVKVHIQNFVLDFKLLRRPSEKKKVDSAVRQNVYIQYTL